MLNFTSRRARFRIEVRSPALLGSSLVAVFTAAVFTVSSASAADCPTTAPCATAAPTSCQAPDSRKDRERVPLGDVSQSQDEITRLGNGDQRLRGHVEIRQGDRVVRAEEIDISEANQSLRVPGPVELSDPNLTVRADGAKVDSAGGAAEFERASFEIPARAGRGSAEKIRLSGNGEVDLQDVRYTTCPLPDPTWQLKVGNLHIDQQARVGSGTAARLDFKGVPILYTPYISFPVGNEPKSGLLMPEPGQSSRSGWQLSLPWYWRIAPNYDATFTPTYYSSRGFDLGGEFRFLANASKGQFAVNFLPNDRQTQTDRTFVDVSEQTDFTSRLRFIGSGVNLGDNEWFEDFGGATYTSNVILPRIAQLLYRGDEWWLTATAQNYQIIDPQIARTDRPYAVLPQIALHGFFPDRFALTAAIDGEFASFQRNADLGPNSSVQRLDIAPQLRLPLRVEGAYLEPAIAYRYAAYRLDDPSIADSSPSVGAPKFSIDGGMVFERETGRSNHGVQTLEPRILYAYVPYRNQDALPILDTARPDFSLIQLFETDRYAGADRIGDVNHVALGLTSRVIDGADGRQFLSATLGGLYRFAPERVSLPGEIPERRGSSDIIGELSLTAYRHWTAHIGAQWDPVEQKNERTELSFQYLQEAGKVVNVGYRYRRGDTLGPTTVVNPQSQPQALEQIDTSAAWPIGSAWSLYGRVIYSIKDNAAIDRFGGFEYRSCCWGARVLARRSVSSITGRSDWDFKAQLELNGLSKVGHPVDTFLAESIRGYSAARNDYRSTP